MKIQKLSVKNFLALESVEWDLSGAPIHLCIGPNEAGKSSLRDSLQVLLTGGQARGIKKHEEQAAFIREGAKAADLSLTWDDGQVTTYHKTPKSPATTSGPVPSDQVMAIILSDPMAFLSLEDKARREVLFRLLPGLSPKGETIYQKLAVMIPDFDQGSTIPHQMAGLAATQGFRAAEQEAITRRRIAKRARDESTVEDPAPRATIGGVLRILPDIQVADVEAGLSKLRVERDNLQKKLGKAEAQADKLPELEKELQDLEAAPVESPAQGEIAEWEDALKINRPILADLERQAEALKPGKAPRFYPELCPVFNGTDVPCPKSNQVGIPGDTAPDPEKVKKVGAQLQEQREQVDRLSFGLLEAKNKQVDFDIYIRKVQDLTAKITKVKEQQLQAQDTAGIAEHITAIDTRLQTGDELRDAVREFWRKKEVAEAAAVKLEVAEKEVGLYDALAKALAPSGIPSQLIAEALRPVNDLLEVPSVYLFPGRDLALTEDLNIELSGSPYATLSKSIKFRVGVAFQYVLAKLAEARLLLIDEADLLDHSNRTALIDFLLEIEPDFDTIIIFATSQEAKPSPIPEIQIWWLESGRIRLVEEGDALRD